jgi:RimJ/RimL family protein N-acetyltransferase
MDDGRVRLRPLRISDIPFMYRELLDKDILKADGLTKLMAASWFHLWWWLRKTFIFRYAIEADSGLVGFMGLHHLIPGKSAELTLLIADERGRRLGYGTKAFTLLAQALERYSSVEKLIVRVKPDNKAARSFWSKMGLEIQYDENGMHVMSVGLTSRD